MSIHSIEVTDFIGTQIWLFPDWEHDLSETCPSRGYEERKTDYSQLWLTKIQNYWRKNV